MAWQQMSASSGSNQAWRILEESPIEECDGPISQYAGGERSNRGADVLAMEQDGLTIGQD